MCSTDGLFRVFPTPQSMTAGNWIGGRKFMAGLMDSTSLNHRLLVIN